MLYNVSVRLNIHVVFLCHNGLLWVSSGKFGSTICAKTWDTKPSAECFVSLPEFSLVHTPNIYVVPANSLASSNANSSSHLNLAES